MKRKHTKLHEWQLRIQAGGEKCANCGSVEILTVDHIIPIFMLEPLYRDTPDNRLEMIYNDEDNFQVLCKYCNKQKGCLLDIRNPKTIPLLEKLIKQLKNL